LSDVCSYFTTQIKPNVDFATIYSNGSSACIISYTPTGAFLSSFQVIPSTTCPYGGTVSGANCINAPACAPLVRDVETGACEIPPKSNGASICPNNIDIKNPINAGTGNKWQHETDLPGGVFSLSFDRYYNASTTANPSNLGAGWSPA
jgi:hypothetical protein